MISFLLDVTAGFVLPLANPLALIYLGLALVHAFAAHYHLALKEGRPLAYCGGLASTLYLALAIMHGVAH